MKTRILAIAILLYASSVCAQQVASELPPQSGVWDLNQCISFALKSNIGVEQRSLQIDQNQIRLNTARMSRLPSVSASVGADASFGRALQSNNTYANTSQRSGSLGASANISLFEGLRINKQIKGSKLDLAASVQDLERAREDLSINVMTLYLQVLYTKDLEAVAERQLALSTEQSMISAELVKAGKQPESTLYESQALVANDQLSLTQARNDRTLALLDLSQAMNRENAAGFDVATPQLDSLTMASMHMLGSAQKVYNHAVEVRPHILAEKIRLEGSHNEIAIARSGFYPSLSLGGGYNTGVYSGSINSFGEQFRHNSREYVGLSLSIPIFNRQATRNGVRTAKLAVASQQLTLTQAEQDLRKLIEQAWYSADAAYSKYLASQVALASARVAFTYEKERSQAGRSTIFDFNDAKNRMQKSESELIRSKFEFLFRSKILDFYSGQPIKL